MTVAAYADATGWTMNEVRQHTLGDIRAFTQHRERRARERRMKKGRQ